ncbi:hypothetical protein [Falsihalocynthiibacter arcticus]|uniref:Uncharacterized protein n=1 Tax=Falsihalocynthiibacter arcticus TaxID=1579316 RepID=A0A126V3U3_9RHOB|nr:hypothetical protein [Falsihalocynthiibacter arcticus]AML52988.1 hypothetical protein RC74_18550 [Falsihalocynthiibacter arcticus]
MAKNNWTNIELEAAVGTYFQMLALEKRGEKFNKSYFIRELLMRHLPNRTSVDHRMQNISHVLNEKGELWIQGYKPLPNIGPGILPFLTRCVEEHLSPKTAPLPLYPTPNDVAKSRLLPPTG